MEVDLALSVLSLGLDGYCRMGLDSFILFYSRVATLEAIPELLLLPETVNIGQNLGQRHDLDRL